MNRAREGIIRAKELQKCKIIKKKWWDNFKLFYDQCVEIVEYNSIKTPNIYPNLNDQQQFRLNKINEIKDYFVVAIKEGELMSKRLASFDYFDKSLIILSLTSGSISIASFANVIGAPVGIASAISVSFHFISFQFSFNLHFQFLQEFWKNC